MSDIDYAVVTISELEALFDSWCESEMTDELEDIDSDILPIAEPREPYDIITGSVEIAVMTNPPALSGSPV